MKIAVLGYVGSGKTYLSDYIAKKKDIPVLHLDSIKWDKEWKPIDDSVVLPQVAEFMAQNDWIIDGYYKYLMIDERFEKADKIIFLLLPRFTCFFRALDKKVIKMTLIGGFLNSPYTDVEIRKDEAIMLKLQKSTRIKLLF